jgi:hypothetical protein
VGFDEGEEVLGILLAKKWRLVHGVDVVRP